MEAATRTMWADQDQRHTGDRPRLFSAVREAIGESNVLYPGSYVDIAPSFVFRSVTYVDMDKRAPRFFADSEGVVEIISSRGGDPDAEVQFIHADYREGLSLPTHSFDLLVSLYAGFVSEHCTRYLKPGGTLLVVPSHGDAAMASIDPLYELTGVVVSKDGDYRVHTQNLDTYLIAKSPVEITPSMLHDRGKGIQYTRSPFAYLFRRVN